MSEAIAAKLDEARALIEKGWCQGEYAFDASGQAVWPTDPSCVCFCSMGAIVAVVGGDHDFETELKRPLAKAIKCRSVIGWNDAPERTQADVIEAFRKAAELARGEQSVMGRAG